MINVIEVEGTFPGGTKLVTIRHPYGDAMTPGEYFVTSDPSEVNAGRQPFAS